MNNLADTLRLEGDVSGARALEEETLASLHKKPPRVFVCDSHKDEELRRNLDTHLKPLLRQGVIDYYVDLEITPGKKWTDKILENLGSSDIILLLVSPAFLDSDYLWDKEMELVWQRSKAGPDSIPIPSSSPMPHNHLIGILPGILERRG